MPLTLQKIVTLYPKQEEELGSPINQRAVKTALEPPDPDQVIVSADTPEAELTYSPVTGTELLSLLGITGNIEVRLDALEAIYKYQVPGFSTEWSGLAIPTGGESAAVFTYIVPALKIFVLDKADFIGRADCIMRIKVDGTTIDRGQLCWTNRDVQKVFPFGHRVNAGSTITITLENIGEDTADFWGSVHGRLVDE